MSPDTLKTLNLPVDTGSDYLLREFGIVDTFARDHASGKKKKKTITAPSAKKNIDTISRSGNDSASFPLEDYRLSDVIAESREAAFVQVSSAARGIQYGPLFKGHELNPVHSGEQPFQPRNPDWFFGIVLLVILIFTWFRVFYYKILGQMFNAFFSNTVTSQIVRDENILVQRASVMLTAVFNLTAALFLYQITILYDIELGFIGRGFPRFLVFALVISLTYFTKFLFLKGAGIIFRADKPVSSYIFNIFLINNMLGIALIPFILFLAFIPASFSFLVVNFALFLVSGAFLYRIVRGFNIGLSVSGFSAFHLFLYLCTLEFAPLLILYKVLS